MTRVSALERPEISHVIFGQALRRPPSWAAVSKDGNRRIRASGHPSRRPLRGLLRMRLFFHTLVP
jgi:hypothetical protein